MEYLFVLGRDPVISLVEIVSYFETFDVDYNLISHDEENAVFDLPQVNPSKIMKRLGGTIKIGELTEDYDYYGKNNKINYGIGIIKGDPSDFIDDLKAKFKKEKLKAMLKTPTKGEMQLMPKQSSRLDLEFLWDDGKVYRVVSVSNPKEYKLRDERRPKFDALSAVSIRLAKILINLSQAKDEVLDPFCGQGTILQEALLNNMRAKGVDKDTDNAKENLEWLGNFASRWELVKGDARKVSSYFDEIPAVATEPYMGPYWEKIPDQRDVKRTIDELTKLYTAFLKDLKTVLKGKVAMIIPRFKTTKGRLSIDVNTIMNEAGYRLYSPLKEIAMPLAYYDTKSKLERFIYVLEPIQGKL